MRFEDDCYGDELEYIEARPAWFVPDERIINRPRKGGFLFPSMDGEGEEDGIPV